VIPGETYRYLVRAVDDRGLPSVHCQEATASPGEPAGLWVRASPVAEDADGSPERPFPTIAQALAAVPAGEPATVRVMPGDYTERVVLDRPGVRVLGQDREGTRIAGDGAGPVVEVSGDGASLESVTVDGGDAAPVGVRVSCRVGCSVRGCAVRRIRGRGGDGGGAAGIRLAASQGVMLWGNHVQDVRGEEGGDAFGLHLTGASGSVLLHNTVRDVHGGAGEAGGASGIHVRDGEGNSMSGNVVMRVRSGAAPGREDGGLEGLVGGAAGVAVEAARGLVSANDLVHDIAGGDAGGIVAGEGALGVSVRNATVDTITGRDGARAVAVVLGASLTLTSSIVTSCSHRGLDNDPGNEPAALQVSYSDVWGHGTAGLDHVLEGPGNLSADPRYRAPAPAEGEPDLRLDAGSPCIDRGDPDAVCGDEPGCEGTACRIDMGSTGGTGEAGCNPCPDGHAEPCEPDAPAFCSSRPELSVCDDGDPSRAYDLCIGGACLSPGCGTPLCNTGGPGYPALPRGRELVIGEPVFGDEVVEDAATGLTWTRDVQPPELPWDAVAGCEALSHAGRDDWRLANNYELLSLLDHDASGFGLFAPDLFDLDGAERFILWSMSTSDNGLFWLSVRRLTNEHSAVVAAQTNPSFGRGYLCVRGRWDAPRPAERFAFSRVEGVETLDDTWTGLSWERSTRDRARLPWLEALEACGDLPHPADARPWEAPTVNDLYGLVNDRVWGPGLRMHDSFAGEPAEPFWSSEAVVRRPDGGESWTVDFSSGDVSSERRDSDRHVRCLRRAP